MKVVGARIPRYDGVAHVTGRTTYVDDVRVPGTLWAKALRSPHHHAGITRLDMSKAESMPGVQAVITWKDVPLLALGHLAALGIPADEPLLARDEVRYKGEPIALVAAESEQLAAAAVDAIEIGFEERPALFDLRQAFDPDAPQIHPWGNWYPFFGTVESSLDAGADAHGVVERPPQHIRMDRRQIRKGDIDWAFENADTIVQGVYRPAAIEHAPIETQVCQVVPEPDGRLTIYSCTQALYFSLGVVAAHLKVPLNRLKLVGGTTGGGFGGKVDTATETMASLLALKSGRPVKWRWTREEEFLCSSTRAPWHMEIATAVTKDGWILGQKMLTLHDSGAYARFSPYGLTKHSFHHTGAYSVPNLQFDGYVVFTNRVPTTAMRGFGVTSVSFAVETHMSRIADVLGLDPIEIRLKNANRIGDTSPNGVAYTDPSTVSTLHTIAEAIGQELPADYRTMTNEPRSGDLLPEHLVAQVGSTEGH
jgi:CO/xanthine dehydrogenase Mo-binding subunit